LAKKTGESQHSLTTTREKENNDGEGGRKKSDCVLVAHLGR